MTERDHLLNSIVARTADYRSTEICPPTAAHVDRWISQFSAASQQAILTEMDHVLARSYVSQAAIDRFLTILANSPKLAGTDPRAFWSGASLLEIPTDGSSQRYMRERFRDVLAQTFGQPPGVTPTNTFIYLDDFSFTGNRILSDLTGWMERSAPPQASVHIVVIGYHTSGQYYVGKTLARNAQQLKRNITFKWWRMIAIEDRLYYINVNDVMRPTSIPTDAEVQRYVATLKYVPKLRTPGQAGMFFSSEAGRNLLEQEFLRAGVRIRDMCPRLGDYQRPLGNMVLETLGFGAMTVTARNCPNNAPLVLWAGDPWYPLFPRRTN